MTNEFSIYQTSNNRYYNGDRYPVQGHATLNVYAEKKANGELEREEEEKITGYARNNLPFQKLKASAPPTELTITKKKLVDHEEHDSYRRTLAMDSYGDFSSVKGHLKEHEMLLNKSSGPLTVEGPDSTGYKTNANYFKPPKRVPEKEPVDKATLKTLRVEDPIEAENEGRGPSMYSTTYKAFHDPKTLQYGGAPHSRSEIDAEKSNSIKLAGGYTSNRIDTQPKQLKRAKMAGSTSIYAGSFKRAEDQPTRGPTSEEQHGSTMPPIDQSKPKPSPFAEATYPANKISEKTARETAAHREYIKSTLNPETLKELKSKDPIEYDDLTNNRGTYDTMNRVQFEATTKPPMSKEEILNALNDPRSGGNGFSTNLQAPYLLKGKVSQKTIYNRSYDEEHSTKSKKLKSWTSNSMPGNTAHKLSYGPTPFKRAPGNPFFATRKARGE
mmetsp:Transcript_4877/g.7221  ORF Transcript_4877/g.7221 Transcript_4877/m.7221 type:complete len:442 (-) Transcript_4877:28-1353(-)